MKKISLKNVNLKEVEQLSREQLKNVLGGFSGSTGPDVPSDCSAKCTCPPAQKVKDSNQTAYSVSVSCNGGCVAEDGVGAECVTGSNASYCDSSLNCEDMPILT